MSISAIKNHIIFQFVDPVNTRGEFEEAVSEGGIFIKGGFDKSAKSPRWAKVLSVGKQCDHVQVGDNILIPALRWTEGVKYNDEFFWKTDETQLVGYTRDGCTQFTPLNQYVVFTPIKELVTQSAAGLLIVSHTPADTPCGTVVFMDKECEPALAAATIFYDSSNFFNDFTVDTMNVSFINENDILVYVPTGE